MRSFAVYFLFAVACGGALAWAAATWDTRRVESFYGFAETAETEINFNYPIEVEEILVQPGASVKAGDVLMRVRRARERERLADQDFRIEELRAEGRLTAGVLDGEIAELDAEYEAERTARASRRAEVAREQTYRRSLLEALAGPDARAPDGSGADGGGLNGSGGYQPLRDELDALDRAAAAAEETYRRRRDALERERDLARAPRAAEARRLAAERDFDAAQREVTFEITAPADGVVGSVNAKLAEHKSSFAPLVIFYEPNPREVKAYIHEDRLLEAQVGDSVVVTSVSNPESSQPGRIVGLGSRIVEIPPRLRRMPEISTYGREVIVDIPADNPFLQKEKVELHFKRALGG